ncbi:hypothetical protein J6590_088722 [Homalodisca vitripennis]|nr:hypothetical protein J6590_088722 [Homalodisca vitripennis]
MTVNKAQRLVKKSNSGFKEPLFLPRPAECGLLTFLLLHRLVSDAVSDLTPGIWSHVRLKKVDGEEGHNETSTLFCCVLDETMRLPLHVFIGVSDGYPGSPSYNGWSAPTGNEELGLLQMVSRRRNDKCRLSGGMDEVFGIPGLRNAIEYSYFNTIKPSMNEMFYNLGIDRGATYRYADSLCNRNSQIISFLPGNDVTYNLDAQIGESSAFATALLCGVKANFETVGLDIRGKFGNCTSSFVSSLESLTGLKQEGETERNHYFKA